jgi:hypothetical protein
VNNLHDELRADLLAHRVVWFREAHVSSVLALLAFLLTRYRLYRATDADGCDLFDQISAQNFTALTARSSDHYWIDFYSDDPPLFRPCFLITTTESELFDVKLHFDLFEFPDPPPIAELLDTLQQIATLLNAKHWSIHHELNDQWQSGDFSAATLIYAKHDKPA